MNVQQLLQDLETGCVTEIVEAANSFYNEVRGLTERQQFFIYPSGRIYAMNCVDGTSRVLDVDVDGEVILRHRYPQYFAWN